MATTKEELFETINAYRKNNRRKSSKTPTDTDGFESIAKILRETYDWMDSMPLDGWLWEILRRTPTYQELCRRLLDALPPEGQAVLWSEGEPSVKLLLSIATLGIRPVIRKEGLANNEGKLIVAKQGLRDSREIVTGIPLPDCEYRDYRLEHPLIDTRYFKVSTYEKAKRLSWHTYVNIETLHVGNPEDTIYVGVSRFAKKVELQELWKELAEHLTPRPSRKRPDTWKQYLIVYDLRKHECEYSLIVDILQNAYPRKFRSCTEHDVRTFFKNAVDLIEKDNYREFLPF